jgi:3-phosphoshikimate 1-carboxyvinyltransferase
MSALHTSPRLDSVKGRCAVPGDKSISHRAALLAAMADGQSRIGGFSPAGDCRATLAILAELGVGWVREGSTLRVHGRGPEALMAPGRPLDCGRSGTTIRLTIGLVAGAAFSTTLTGDGQLLRRPMSRVAEPLRLMGAGVELSDGGRPPLTVRGGPLRGIEYVLPVASAQVKSALLLAGLQASGTTVVVEPSPTRDHTERLLEAMGAPIRRWEEGAGPKVAVSRRVLAPIELDVPGDFSSAAPFVALASLLPGSDLRIEGVGLNPGRTGFLRILERMGGAIEVTRYVDGVEPSGDLRIRHGELRATVIEPAEVPGAIDELPLVGLVATQADGVTEVRGASELRVKESDRIAGLVAGLRALGGDARELEDGFAVRGPTPLRGGPCDARADHRLAMAFRVASFVASGDVNVEGLEFVPDSFPGFEALLGTLR